MGKHARGISMQPHDSSFVDPIAPVPFHPVPEISFLLFGDLPSNA